MRSTKPSKRDAPSVAGTRIGSRVGDPTGRASEEDLLLLHSLKLLGCPDALQSWPELASIKCELQRCMFATPNRTGMETVIYYLLSVLLGRDSIKKEFKDVWPTASQSQMREFRSRCVDLIKKYATDWGVSSESQQLLPALLQRHCGQKLVRLLCEVSYAAMEQKLISIQGHDAVVGTERPSTVSTTLHPAMIRIGRAQILREQKRFLNSVLDAKSHMEQMRSAASTIIKTYSELIDREAISHRQLNDLQNQRSETDQHPLQEPSPQSHPNWDAIFATVDRTEELSRLLENLMNADADPCAISGEKLLGSMTQCRTDRLSKCSESTTDLDSSLFGMESAVSVGMHGSTEVDLLSMAWSWAKCSIGDVVEALMPLTAQPRKAFVRELMDDASLPDSISRTQDLHIQSVTRLQEMKRDIIRDIEKLDVELEESHRSLDGMPVDEERLPSIISMLEE